MTPSRQAAFAVLESVARSDAHSDDLLHGPMLEGMSDADRQLSTALVMTTLRQQIALDARLTTLLSRPDVELALPVQIALRLGATQLLHFDRIPRHAAINESVELARISGHAHAAGMVNAVLRKLATAPAPPRKLHESTAVFAERLGHPAWLVERWVKHYGVAAARAICEYGQHEPSTPHLFAAELQDAPPMPWMDDGSRLVAELAAAAMPAAKRIWDCCAAPGGKTVVLGRRHPDAMVIATDVSIRRERALEARLQRELPHARVLQADATNAPADIGMFDLILCDVPCSGTGTLARNPEIRHRLRPAEILRQAQRQQAILQGALRHLAPGGKVLYSTCSLEPEESEAVIDAALRENTDVREVNIAEPLACLPVAGEDLVRQGRLRTVPGVNLKADGFFAALLERRSDR